LTAQPVTLHYKEIDKTEILGRTVEPEDILPELLDDKDYYIESGGGVTLSGGEVMLQTDEIVPLIELLRQNGIAVLIDTAGNVPYRYFEKLNPIVDGYLFDFKTASYEKYKSIGGDMKTVTENIRNLIRDGVNLHIRIPLIPDFNTDEDSINGICEKLTELGIKAVELLPFHRLGTSKYKAMGQSYLYENVPPLTKDEIKNIEKAYKRFFAVKTER
jgi:pyruvate formate lyase activating enzyme